MELKEKLNEIATSKGWAFVYARRDYQNLYEAAQYVEDSVSTYAMDETVMFVDPIVRSPKSGTTEYKGKFMVVTKSNMDWDYDERYVKYIEPLIPEFKSVIKSLSCDFDVKEFRMVEIINLFDLNADGFVVTYSIDGYD